MKNKQVITVKDVKDFVNMTECTMMEAKEALNKFNGDADKAYEYHRNLGKAIYNKHN